eukprot:TRINITY_DN19551_c0_g1_i1.p1 TRINITY_DN19551_c0_g1~~TRINITY_DN19551_c0_g1_i1.p1  ORF type:complete len:344 (+),score=76.11 TRINITY_DN19551_c0_g1_i1:78-1109(+)
MVLLTISAAAIAGGACGTYVTWDKYPKPFILKKLKEMAPRIIGKALADSECSLGGLDFNLGPEVEVTVESIKVGNLPPYKSATLVAIDRIFTKVDMKAFAKSGFKKVIVTELTIDGVELTIEKGINLTTSNIKELLRKMDEIKKKKAAQEKGVEITEVSTTQRIEDRLGDISSAGSSIVAKSSSAVQDAYSSILSISETDIADDSAILADAKADAPEEASIKKPKVHIEKLEVTAIKVGAVSTMLVASSDRKALVPVPDVKFEDFSSKFGETNAIEIVQMLLKEVFLSAGKALSGIGSSAVGAVEATVERGSSILYDYVLTTAYDYGIKPVRGCWGSYFSSNC